MEDESYSVVIEGGSPWGFGIQGGLDFRSPLRVKMVSYLQCSNPTPLHTLRNMKWLLNNTGLLIMHVCTHVVVLAMCIIPCMCVCLHMFRTCRVSLGSVSTVHASPGAMLMHDR